MNPSWAGITIARLHTTHTQTHTIVVRSPTSQIGLLLEVLSTMFSKLWAGILLACPPHIPHMQTHTQMLFGHGKHKYGCSLKYGVINLQRHFTIFLSSMFRKHTGWQAYCWTESRRQNSLQVCTFASCCRPSNPGVRARAVVALAVSATMAFRMHEVDPNRFLLQCLKAFQ